MYSYDHYGWFSPVLDESRQTDIAPPAETDDLKANWTGLAWVLVPYSAPPAPVPPPIDPRIWQIYTGSFKDRFDVFGYPGLKGLLIGLGRTNDVCYAAFGDLVGRDYVDLLARRGELLAVFAAMAEVVKTAGKPEFTVAMQYAILETMTAESERYVKGLQP